MDSSGFLAWAGAKKPQPPPPMSVGSSPSFTRGAPASSKSKPASAPTTEGPPSPRERATLPASAACVDDWSSSVSIPSATGFATSRSNALRALGRIEVELLGRRIPPVHTQAGHDARQALELERLAAQAPASDRVTVLGLERLRQLVHGVIAVEEGLAVAGRVLVGEAEGLEVVDGHVDHAADAVRLHGHAVVLALPDPWAHRVADEVGRRVDSLDRVDRILDGHRRSSACTAAPSRLRSST